MGKPGEGGHGVVDYILMLRWDFCVAGKRKASSKWLVHSIKCPAVLGIHNQRAHHIVERGRIEKRVRVVNANYLRLLTVALLTVRTPSRCRQERRVVQASPKVKPQG